MTINELILLWSSRNHFSLPHHQELSLLRDWMEHTIHLKYHQKCLILRFVPDAAGLNWMFSDAVLSQRFVLFQMRTGKWSFHFLVALTLLCIEPSGVEFWSVHLFQFFNLCDYNVSFPDSSRVQCIAEKYTWQDFCTELMQSRLVFCRNRVIFGHCSKRYYLSVESAFRTAFLYGVFPSDNFDLEMISQIATTFHGLRPPFVHPDQDCNSTADVSFLSICDTALLAIPFVCDLRGVDVQRIPR